MAFFTAVCEEHWEPESGSFAQAFRPSQAAPGGDNGTAIRLLYDPQKYHEPTFSHTRHG